MPVPVFASPIFETAPFAISLTRLPDATIVAVNSAFLTLFECTRQEVIGRSSTDLGLSDPQVHARLMAEFREQGVVRNLECERRTRAGATVHLSLNVDPVEFGGESFCVTTIEDITERRRAEAELRESAALLGTIADRSRDVIFAKDLAGRIRFANPATLALIGKPLEEVIGRTDLEFLDDKDAARRVMENDRRIMDGGTTVELEEYVPLPDGSERIWLSHKTPYRDTEGQVVGLLGISRDITERKRTEAVQQRMAEQRQLALDAASLGWWRVDVATGRVSWDERHREIFGEDGEEQTVDGILGRMRPDEARAVQARVDRVLDPRNSPRFEAEYRITRADGEERWIEAHGLALFDGVGEHRKATTLVGTVQDITERKREQQALLDAYARMEEADRRKDEFIALLSHELRNPLAPIRYALPVLQTQPLDDAGRRAVAVIDRQLTHLTRLVDDLLDVARISGGKIELRREHVALGAILAMATEAASPAIAAARHTLHVNVPSQPLWLEADASRLAQVVSNLLDNAAKYTPPGGEITLEVGASDGHAAIHVRDTGAGLRPEALPHVFEMFWRAARPGDTQGGLGIGLALAKLLVEMHGGTIEAHSAGLGRGAEFVVRMPVAGTRREAAEAGAAPAVAAGRRLKVLVVDDNADLVEMLSMVVAQAGHDIRKALDGRSAIEVALSYRPDVILLDLGLPGMSGLDAGREIRRHQEGSGVKIVALTGWGQPDDIRRTRDAGFDAHLTKPTDPADLERLLAQYASEIGCPL